MDNEQAPPATVVAENLPPELGTPKQLVRLDLACGQRCREGFEGIDLYAPAARKIDLLKFPWPLESDSVDELHCSHFVEHIPARDLTFEDLIGRLDEDGLPAFDDMPRWLGQDMFFAFFDECWRVLRHEGKFKVIVPSLQSTRAFQDPTHRRFIPIATFLYLNREWRKAQGLDHYRVRANFAVTVFPSIPTELSMRAEEVQRDAFEHHWNSSIDLYADLVADKT
jgi:hypothetical protein